MENTNQPSPRQVSNEEFLAIEARLSALERQLAEQSKEFEAAGPQEQPLGRAELAEALDDHRDQLRDYEKALVERIADVDDDRRSTTSRLQRAWQTQREEIDQRLKRHAGLFGGLLTLFVLLFALAIFSVYRQAMTVSQPQMDEDLSEIRQTLARLSGERTVYEQVQERLDQLTLEVKELASALEGADMDVEGAVEALLAKEHAARVQSEDRLADEIQRLEAERRRMNQSLGSLRSVLQALEFDRAGEEGAYGTPTAGPEAGGAEERPVSEAEQAGSVDAAAGVSVDEEVGTGAPDPEQSLIAGGDLYALQLIGFFNRKSLDEFVTREGLPARVYSIQRTYRGRPWYVVIHSLHDDYAAAEEELARLPADLVELNPWIRPLSEVAELRIIETGQQSE